MSHTKRTWLFGGLGWLVAQPFNLYAVGWGVTLLTGVFTLTVLGLIAFYVHSKESEYTQ